MGISTGGKLLCASIGCKFNTCVASNELFEHCRRVHQWKDCPCEASNCNYVAYSKTALKFHSARFHSNAAPTNYPNRCTKENCGASFSDRTSLRLHENIHDNVLLKCVFCPFTCVRPVKMTDHQRLHFNIRDYNCEICNKSFHTQGNLNVHYNQKHSDDKTKCPICEYTSTKRLVYSHLAFKHKISGPRWDKENNKFLLQS